MLFDRMPNLEVLSIQNCTGLTGDIDLTSCAEITQIDASGTTVSVLVPENSKLTKYEVGTPTSIAIENPTVLTPAGVVVDSYANLDSLVIKNMPNTKSYALFENIFRTYMFGGSFVRGYQINRDNGSSTGIPYTEPSTNKNKYYVSSYIPVVSGHSITIEMAEAITAFELNSQFTVVGRRHDKFSASSTTFTIANNVEYIIFGNLYADNAGVNPNVTVTDNTTNAILFRYQNS